MSNTYKINPSYPSTTDGLYSYNTNWTVASTSIGSTTSAILTVPSGSNTVVVNETATLDVKGNVRINGEDLEERLKRIETVLHIPTRDVTMESKYPKLERLYQEYTKELEKLKTWEVLKESK